MNYLLTLAYDGTAYSGFQVQPNAPTIAKTFQNALEAVVGCRPDIKGCSRTDAGVHAYGFALNFHLENPLKFPLTKLPLALNAHLPEDIRVQTAREVSEEFHARYAAHTKTYQYRIRNSGVSLPFDAKYTTQIPHPLNAEAMQAAAQKLVGRYDCIAFCAAGSSAAAHGDTVRNVTACTVAKDGDLITITITADGYLYNMVRIIAGTLVEVGRGKLRSEEIPDIIASKNRQLAGPTLAARGLALVSVDYPETALELLKETTTELDSEP